MRAVHACCLCTHGHVSIRACVQHRMKVSIQIHQDADWCPGIWKNLECVEAPGIHTQVQCLEAEAEACEISEASLY
jgi:hypothetical protein